MSDRPRIVVVDDDPGFREMLRGMLEEQGFDIVGEAEDGRQAVDVTEELSPDVVLMDLRMPKLSGIEATRSIKALLPLVQIIILSAYEDAGLKRGADEAGVYCYLIKGCPPSMIKDVLQFAWSYKVGLEEREHPASPAPAS
jgi:DNA-binding NarL/FixJ family response regulator